jgi:hypothetical protein
MHPLSVETFEPFVFRNIEDKLFNNVELSKQIYFNLITNKVDDARDVFNDDDFVNKVRFFHTQEVVTLDPIEKELFDIKSPNIPDNKLVYYVIPEIPTIHGVYVCKTDFSGKSYIEHFIVFKSVFPYITIRVKSNDYPDGMFNSLQTLLNQNEKHLSTDQFTALIKYMMSDRVQLNLQEAEPHTSTFMFNMLRTATETVKRIAYV